MLMVLHSLRLMQFTARELKVIERLRKYQRQWSIARWIKLLNAVLLSGLCAWTMTVGIQREREVWRVNDYVLSQISQLQPQDGVKELADFYPSWREDVLFLAFLFPIWLLFASLSCAIFVNVIINWRGHVDRMLLLKLLEEQQGLTDKDARTA